MEKVTGGVTLLVIALVFAGRCQNDFRQMYSGRATLNAPTATEQPRTTGFTGDPAKIAEAIAAIKPIATGQSRDKKGNVKMTVTVEDANRANEQKIAVAAPLVLDALNECPKAIPPEQLTSHWGNETDFCPGLPVKMCPVSSAGARTPLQLMPDTIKQYARAGEDPETLAVSLKIAVRHLCFAKGKGNIELDPASDAAILRYNASTEYLKNIRAVQAKHAPIWASIRSGNGPMVASAGMATQQVAINTVRVVDGPPKVQLFPSNPLDGYIKWFSAYHNRRVREGGKIVPHGGVDLGCQYRGQAVQSVCSGKVEFAAVLGDDLGGNTVIVACDDGQHKTSEMHMDAMSVAKGQLVAAHQQVGACGTTGNADNGKSGPHVHFKLERLVAGVWETVSPCAGFPNEKVLDCGSMEGPKTDFAPLTTIASN